MDREMKKQFWKEVRMTKYEYPHARMRMEDWFTVFTSPEELRAAKHACGQGAEGTQEVHPRSIEMVRLPRV